MKFGTNNDNERESWLQKTLLSIPAKLRILDAGAGELRFKKYCTHLDYVSQDFGQYDGQGDGLGLQTGTWDNSKLDIVCDIISIPEKDDSFDAILCSEVFEHIADPVKAVKEFQRLLKPGGTLIITAPFCSITHFAPYHYYSGFNRYFYEEHLKDNFEIIEITPSGNYFQFMAQELRRIKSITKITTKTSARIWERIAFWICVKFLERISTHDINSSQVLNYGFFIKAIKK